MSDEPELIVLADADALAADVAARTLDCLRQGQGEHGRAAIALTAGSIMEKVWTALAISTERESVDWSRVDVFWADERFVPSTSPERNDGPANDILFDRAPFSAAARHPMPASDGPNGDDLAAAAAGYEQQLRTVDRGSNTGEEPSFDLILLGVGPDGHCASLFPGHPALQAGGLVIGVRDSPKPPPLRTSLTFTGLHTAREIWLVVSGTGKAEAVARAFAGAGKHDIPAAGARGAQRTLWLADQDAVSALPTR